MSHIMQPPLPPLFALPPGACAFLHARNVPVSAAPENCAMAMVGDSIAICMSYVAPPPLRHHHESLCTVVKLQSPVPTVPDSLFDTLVSPLPVESSTSHSSARSRYVSPSKRKKKRLKREFRRLSSIDDTVFNTEDVPELRPVTYVSTAFIYLENVGISGDESPSASDISGDELDYLKGTEIASTEPVSACDSADECDQSQWLPPSDPRSSQYLDYLYHKETEIVGTEPASAYDYVDEGGQSHGLPAGDCGQIGVDELPLTDSRNPDYLYYLFRHHVDQSTCPPS